MNFYDFCWHDSEILKIEVVWNKVILFLSNDLYASPLRIVCNEVVGFTDLCMWEDTTVYSAKICEVNDNITPFLDKIRRSHSYKGNNYEPIRKGLMNLSVELTNDIVFNIYCYEILVE